MGIRIEFLLLEGGPLEQAYRDLAPTHRPRGDMAFPDLIESLVQRGFTTAIVNTAVAGRVVPQMERSGIATVLLVHELPLVMETMKITDSTRRALISAQHVIFPARSVRDVVLAEVGVQSDSRIVVRHQGLYRSKISAGTSQAKIREELKLAQVDRLVLGIGYADLRKGFDIFLEVWRQVRRRNPSEAVHFCWLGKIHADLSAWLGKEIAIAEATGRFHLPGQRKDVEAFLDVADVFLLPSREDPFPSVAIEALGAGLPTVAFDSTGGVPDLLRETGLGRVVPYGDAHAMAEEVIQVLTGEPPEFKAARRKLVAEQFDWSAYLRDLVRIALPDLAEVSAVVPNFNYAQYLEGRLKTIFDQTYPVCEVVVLDDCSSDGSVDVVKRAVMKEGRVVRLAQRNVNSGSVFAQWRTAAELTDGEFIWIAEADDLSAPGFLAHTVALLKAHPDMRIAFTDSRTVLGDGTHQMDSYKDYYATVESGALATRDIFPAKEFVRRFLSVKNLILNVSSVVWRRDALLSALRSCEEELREYRVAGDWRLYLEVLRDPSSRIGYEATPLNVHRRHADSVTHALDAHQHVQEIARCHGVVAEIFPEIADEVRSKQRAYLVEVAEQLGVTAPGRGESSVRSSHP